MSWAPENDLQQKMFPVQNTIAKTVDNSLDHLRVWKKYFESEKGVSLTRN